MVAFANSGERPEIDPPRRSRRGSPERQAILDAAKEFLRGRDYPTLTADIYEAIKGQVEIGGNNPRNNLSAMLSNSSDFRSHARAGWTLAVPTLSETNEASDDLLSRSASEASNSSPALPAGGPDVRPVDPVPRRLTIVIGGGQSTHFLVAGVNCGGVDGHAASRVPEMQARRVSGDGVRWRGWRLTAGIKPGPQLPRTPPAKSSSLR